MTTDEVIARLRQLDPTGKAEVLMFDQAGETYLLDEIEVLNSECPCVVLCSDALEFMTEHHDRLVEETRGS